MIAYYPVALGLCDASTADAAVTAAIVAADPTDMRTIPPGMAGLPPGSEGWRSTAVKGTRPDRRSARTTAD